MTEQNAPELDEREDEPEPEVGPDPVDLPDEVKSGNDPDAYETED